MCEDGATVAATPLPSAQLAASFCLQAGPAAFFHGVLQTIGKTSLTTKNVLPSTRNAKHETRNAGDFQTSTDWLSNSDEHNNLNKDAE